MVIVGVGNTACDAAVDLSGVCSQVMSVSRLRLNATVCYKQLKQHVNNAVKLETPSFCNTSRKR